MIEAPEVNFDAKPPKPAKKKAAKKRRKAAAAKPAKSTAPFPGLTRTACADACGPAGCSISGREYCAHPTKGGLQTADMSNPAALKRLQTARDQLQVRIDPDRFK